MKNTKILIFIILIVCLLNTITWAQTTDRTIDENLYLKALSEVLPAGSIIVERDLPITDALPQIINSSHIEYLDKEDLIDRLKGKTSGLRVIKVFPITNKGSRLSIGLNYYQVSYGTGLVFALEGGTTVNFKYDCEKKMFTVDKTEPWAV